MAVGQSLVQVPRPRGPDLAGLPEAAALAKLPAEEREACRKLWADVDALLQRAQRNE
jgi:hypothetical protein